MRAWAEATPGSAARAGRPCTLCTTPRRRGAVDEQSPGFLPAAGCTKLVLGTVSERPKDHVSKTCVGVNSTVGSNPTGTATENPWSSRGFLNLEGYCRANLVQFSAWTSPKVLTHSRPPSAFGPEIGSVLVWRYPSPPRPTHHATVIRVQLSADRKCARYL